MLFGGKYGVNCPMKKNYAILPDVLGITLCVFGVLIAFSLLTFAVSDNALHSHGSYQVQNWIGPGGALLANFAYTSLGFLAWGLPICFIYLGLASFWRNLEFRAPQKLFALVLIFLALSSILEELSIGRFAASFPWGGLLGYGVHRVLVAGLSSLGMWLVCFALPAIGIAILFDGLEFIKTLRLPRIFNVFKKNSLIKNPVISESPSIIGESAIQEDLNKEVAVISEREPEKKVFKESQKAIVGVKAQEFELPPIKLLDYDAPPPVKIDQRLLQAQAERLEKTFAQFGIEGKVREIRPGPVVTCFEYVPAAGIKLSRIGALADDIAMAMTAVQVRVVAPIPGKGAVGIEIPNERRETVYLKEIVADENYRKQPGKLCMALGKTVEGKPYFVNLADMPHVLISGTTGSGKSVSVNAMICSVLYRATPAEVRFLMIDPKMLELSVYDGIPHLLLPPIVDSKKAAQALRWAVNEMERRYLEMNTKGVRDLEGYNKKATSSERMPLIVIVVDEYADLVAVAGKDVEALVMRLAQKARAAGIHVMLATQRPSVDIITGVIKANFPVRISFRLASGYDSKTIINRTGAEKLLGKGDMLMMPPGTSEVYRIHGAFVSEKELSRVVKFWKAQASPNYDLTIQEAPPEEEGSWDGGIKFSDDRYKEAISIVGRTQKCSTSWIQRQMGVGYNRAARMVEQMERDGHVGPQLSAKGDREIFVQE